MSADDYNGDLVRMKNGMIGKIIGSTSTGWRSKYEIVVDGVRCYIEKDDAEVIGVLDRIVDALNKVDSET